MYDKENQQPVAPVPGGGQDLQNLPGLNPGYLQYGPLRQYGGGPAQSGVPGHGRAQFYNDPMYGHLPSTPSALSMHPMQFQHGNSPGAPGMIDTQSWAPVANVVSPEQVQEMYQTILAFKTYQEQQEAKNQEHEQAIRVRDQFLEEFRQTKDALQQYATGNASLTPIKKQQNIALAQAMRSIMLELLYLEGIDENGDEAKDKRLLPTPLILGEEVRKAPDGTRVWNPDWYAGPTQGSVNPQYISTAIKLLKVREEKSPSSEIDGNILNDAKALKQAAITYFTSLRKRYKAQATERGKAEHERIKGNNKLRGRKKAKAASMRNAVALAEAAQGRENTVGYMEIIHTDWMSSERSDCGKMDPIDFKKYRKQKTGSNEGWEVRTLRWRAKKLVRLYLYLRKLQRDHKDSAIESARKKKGSGVRTTRFQCTPINAQDRCPTIIGQTNGLPYKSCINQGWARRTGNHDLIVENDPTHFTIFNLEIADHLLDDEDLGYLAAYEDD